MNIFLNNKDKILELLQLDFKEENKRNREKRKKRIWLFIF